MLVIRARGASQVKALEKLAEEMSAEEVEEVVVPRRRRPGVSTLRGARIAPATQAAIVAMTPTIESFGGEYETGGDQSGNFG